jgi:hypothetical protein
MATYWVFRRRIKGVRRKLLGGKREDVNNT